MSQLHTRVQVSETAEGAIIPLSLVMHVSGCPSYTHEYRFSETAEGYIIPLSLVMHVSGYPSYTHEYRFSETAEGSIIPLSLVMHVSGRPSYTHECRYQRQQRDLSSHCLWLCMYQDVLVTHTSTRVEKQSRQCEYRYYRYYHSTVPEVSGCPSYTHEYRIRQQMEFSVIPLSRVLYIIKMSQLHARVQISETVA